MAARTPRRSFAAPFVVTLAAVPACYVQSSAPPPQPQPVAQPADPHPVVVTNPPRPQPAASTSWHVYKTQDGCEAIVNVECPAGASCNPPPPSKVECPTGIAMDKPMTVVTQGDGTCIVAREPPACPPHAMCNPPRPQTVTCPK